VLLKEVSRELVDALVFEHQRLRQRPETSLKPGHELQCHQRVDTVLLQSDVGLDPLRGKLQHPGQQLLQVVRGLFPEVIGSTSHLLLAAAPAGLNWLAGLLRLLRHGA
jgi:hypothetical protein